MQPEGEKPHVDSEQAMPTNHCSVLRSQMRITLTSIANTTEKESTEASHHRVYSMLHLPSSWAFQFKKGVT